MELTSPSAAFLSLPPPPQKKSILLQKNKHITRRRIHSANASFPRNFALRRMHFLCGARADPAEREVKARSVLSVDTETYQSSKASICNKCSRESRVL